MTTAPSNLLAARQLLLTHLPLSATAVGIVGDPNHRGGYHCGSDRVVPNDYSVHESSRDRNGLSDYASALDEGWWELRVAGKTHNLRTHSVWMVAQCKAGTPDTKDIREIIYSPDGKVVKRWDRLGKRTSGDSSHLSHTHRSYFRDATKSGRDLTALDRRYLTEIGLIEGDDMQADERAALMEIRDRTRYVDGRVYAATHGLDAVPADVGQFHPERLAALATGQQVAALGQQLGQVAAQVEQLRATPPGSVSDEQLERVLRRVMGSVDGASPPATAAGQG